jgi:polyhydroxyalkanoate synthase subunit PhaC
MSTLRQRARDQALALNERLAATANNAFDWLFQRETLVRSGLTAHDVVYRGDPMSLRYYPLPPEPAIDLDDGSRLPVARKRHTVPLVLVPPLGVTTETFDLLPQRSLVRYMAAAGYHTYLVDWGRPQRRHAHLAFKDYAQDMMGTALAQVRRHAGVRDVSLMGWCMGGLLCLLHAGLTQDRGIRNLVTVASPIDLRGGGLVARSAMVLNTPAQLIRKYSGLRLHTLQPQWLHAPGWLTTLAFKLTDPIGSVTTYWDLLTRMWDREFVESHSTTSDYLNNMLLYPGGVIQDLVVKVAVDNKLTTGQIEIGDAVARLNRIKARLLIFAGDSDHLVAPPIARRILDIVASTDKSFVIAPGGHMGVILGSGAQQGVWAVTADWLGTRSRHRSLRRRPGSAAPGKPDGKLDATRAPTYRIHQSID